MHLFGLHNPLRESPAFLLPLFDNFQHGDNGLYIQELTHADQIKRMVPVYDGYSCSLDFSHRVIEVGGPGIFAFSISSMEEIISGSREELSIRLMSRLDEITSEDRYGLRLKILEFSRQWDLVPSAIGDLFTALHSVSPRSAAFWRDNALLTARARLLLGSWDVPEYELNWDQFLSSVSLRISERQPVLSASVSIIGRTEFPSDWLSKLQRELAPYLATFSREELIVENFRVPDKPAEASAYRARDDDQSSALSGPVSWVGVALDRAAAKLAAKLSPRQLGFATQVLDCAGLETSEAIARFREYVETGDVAVAPNTVVVLFFEYTLQGLSDAMAFGSGVSSSVRCHGLTVFNRDRGSELSLEDFEQFASPLDGITIVSSSRLPIHGGVSEITPGGALRELFNQFGEERSSEPFYKMPGLSLYGTGRSKGGQIALLTALENAVSAAANGDIPIEFAETARIVGSSVGRPSESSSTFTQELSRLTRPELDRYRSSFDWARKPFLSGAPQPASIGILWNDFGPQTDAPSNLSACAHVLRAVGYDVLKRGQSIIAAYKGENLFSATSSYDAIGENREFGPEILICKDEDQQAHELDRRLGNFVPLILGDIHYLSPDLDDLRWSLDFLAYRRLRSSRGNNKLAALIEDKLVSLDYVAFSWPIDWPSGRDRFSDVVSVTNAGMRLRSQSARRVEFEAECVVATNPGDLRQTVRVSGLVSPEGIDTTSLNARPVPGSD